jgi:hypothetical protein
MLMISRRTFVIQATGLGVALAGGSRLRAVTSDAPPSLTVYKSPTCGCCKAWVERVKSAGFAVTVKDMPDVEPTKRTMRVPEKLWSCHTAIVGGYTLEGHVPPDLVLKLLRERPKAAGLAVAGMPAGSPGMEVGGMKDPYDVVLFQSDGRSRVYAKR